MKLSTKSRYATRVMLDMAMHYYKGAVRSKDIALRQGISLKYLEQIETCLTCSLWTEAAKAMFEKLNSFTLSDLVQVGKEEGLTEARGSEKSVLTEFGCLS